MKKKIIVVISWVVVILWISLIFYLSSQPAKKSDELSNGVATIVVNSVQRVLFVYETNYKLNIDNLNHYIRKCAHFLEYLILGMLFINALIQSFLKKFENGLLIKYIIITIFFCVLYSISDELHQGGVVDRGPSVRDVFIDSFGALMGIFIYVMGYRVYRKKDKGLY